MLHLFPFDCWFAIQLPSQLQNFIDNKTFRSFFWLWFATCIICSYSLKGKYYRKIIASATKFSLRQGNLPAHKHQRCTLIAPFSGHQI